MKLNEEQRKERERLVAKEEKRLLEIYKDLPIARLYNTRDQSYQRAIKQLTDLLPKEHTQTESNEPSTDYL
ncbi:hypothetical protein [Staphylococcus equorum]|uniref:hypothetical protein n=1 Tax=Staphylococcus equorum TaxID=246432 RepID=UPI00209DBA6B|nr:hypothetical protein [Staphylococcus equorum]